MTWAQMRKALVAAGGSGATAFLAALGAGFSDGRLTATEAGIALGAALVAAATVGRATFQVTNADDESQ